jgi:uncharacterized protein (TIRG00374 family)
MKLGWKGWAGFAISALLIWWTLKDVPVGEVIGYAAGANWWLLAAAIAAATFGFVVRALRWRVLLHPVDPDTPLRSRFGAVSIGFMANNLLPARVGEFARAYAMGRFERSVPVPAAFGSLVVERLLDALMLTGFLVGAVLSPGFPDVELGAGFMLLVRSGLTGVAAIGAAVLLLLLVPGPAVRLIEACARWLPDRLERLVVDSVEAFLESLGVVRSPGLLLRAMAWTVVVWLWNAFSVWLGMMAFGIETGLVSALFAQAVIAFGAAIPAAPGFFGTFHAAAIFALATVYGVDVVQTTAFAYTFHLGGFFPVTFIGLWYARSLGLSLADVGGSEERVESEIEDAGDA